MMASTPFSPTLDALAKSVPVIILAGGEGRRIGGDKPLRMLAGKSLLDRAIEQARNWSATVALAVRNCEAVPSVEDLPLLTDSLGLGPIAGVASALAFAKAHGADRVLTVPCDTPFLPADLLERLNAAMSGSQLAAMATSNGQSHPSCTLWRVEAAASLPAYVAAGRGSLHGFAKTVGFVTVDWPVLTGDSFFNINSAADLTMAEEMLRSR